LQILVIHEVRAALVGCENRRLGVGFCAAIHCWDSAEKMLVRAPTTRLGRRMAEITSRQSIMQ